MGLQDLPEVALVLLSCVPSFVLFVALCLVPACKYGPISRFKGVFSVVLGVSCGFVLVRCFAWLVWLLYA